MILSIPKTSTSRIPTTPYAISYYEPMHKWEIKKRYALIPQIVWEFEDSKSVVHSMIPDDYRVFVSTNNIIWLDYYYEIVAYTRNTINPTRNRNKNIRRTFAVDEYYYLQKLL
ncbi:hypothetical protein N9I00_01255 [bacterium]|nr:hypothetical protein [bacterium]